jgi:hypothetical protein
VDQFQSAHWITFRAPQSRGLVIYAPVGILTKGARGFYGHFALAVGPGELREPLGVLRMHTYVSDDDAVLARRKRTRGENLTAWKKCLAS